MKSKAKKTAKINKRRLLFAVTAIIILAIIVYNIPGIYDFFMYSDYETVDELIGGDYHLERYEDGILAYNNNEVNFVNLKGKTLWNIPVSTTSPKICVGDEYILIADISGKNVYLYNRDNLRATIKTDEEIFDAAVDSKGNIAVATRKQGHKGSVSVYDKNGDMKYVFGSGNGHIGGIDIRKDKIAISQIVADEKALYSRVAVVDWGDNEEVVCESRKDEMIFDVKFQNDGDIIAVSDKSITGYDDDGEIDFSVSYNGRKLMKYNIESDDNLVFSFYGDRNNSVIESYSQNGKIRGSRVEPDEISNIDVCGEAILISSMRSVKRIYPDGDAGEAVISKHDVREIKLFGNRRHSFLTGNSCATVIKIKK